MWLIMKLGCSDSTGPDRITQAREFALDRRGESGYDDKTGWLGLQPFDDLVIVEPLVGSNENDFGPRRELGKTSGEKVESTGLGVGISRAQFPMPEIFGVTFEAE